MKHLLPGHFLFTCLLLAPCLGFTQPSKPTAPGYEVKQTAFFSGIEWLGEEIPYGDTAKRGDTFPLTWAGDNNIYASAGDPLWGKKPDGLDFEMITGKPDNYIINKVNEMPGYFGWGGCGAKPTGLICVKNILYLAFQNMTGMETKTDLAACEVNHGYDASIIYSEDFGKTWYPDIKTNKTPMFPGRIFAAPSFINYGKNNMEATDGYVYAMSGEGWCNGNHIRLGRVPADKIMEKAAWEWVSGFKTGLMPVWTKNEFDATAVLTHEGYLGMTDMVYISKLKRYLLFSWHFNKYADPNNGSKMIIYESPEPWGPFSIVYEAVWETNEKTPYNPRMPLKWFDEDKLEGWLLFSGTWRNYGGVINSHYRAHVRKFKLLLK
jgi:hypothetical protein